MQYFLGVDIGSSKSHAIIADELGRVHEFGEGGPGNHEVVSYAGLQDTLNVVTDKALHSAGIAREHIIGAGFGVSGYDWPSERTPTMRAIQTLGLSAHLELVNDTLLGLLAGAEQGWGIAVVAGSGENCWGRDAQGRIGRMTGSGSLMGEYGGASTIVEKTIQVVSAEWSQRGPPTSLTQVLLEATGALDIEDLVEGLTQDRYQVDAEIAPHIFQAAEEADSVALEVVRWAGAQLGSMVNGVVRQLSFQDESFDVVEMGGVFNAGMLLTDPFHDTVLKIAPGARFVPLNVPPVVGAALLAMEHAEVDPRTAREALIAQLDRF
ncbi:MAG TPA: ATPase [Anaerolineae bacterium]|nr:ATPase [Anaerolineae bacterium]